MPIQWREDRRYFVVRGFVGATEINQKTFSLKRHGGSKRRALAAAKDYEASQISVLDGKARPGSLTSTKVTVTELAEIYWLVRLESKARSTFDNARSDWIANLKPVFGDRRAENLTTIEIQMWQNRIGRRDRSNRKAEVSLKNLRGILNEGVKLDLLAENAAVGVEPMVGLSRPRRFLSHEQLLTFADCFEGQDRAIVLLLGLAGPRWGELAGARVLDWDSKERRLHLTRQLYEKTAPVEMVPLKSKQARWIGVPRRSAEAIEELVDSRVDPEGPLLSPVRRRGMGLSYMRHSNFSRRVFRPVVDEMATVDPVFKGLRIHDLRHTAASLWISRGASPTVVAAQLGHSTAAFTLRTYAHLYEEDVSSAARLID